MKADDHKRINIKGNILIITFNKQKKLNKIKQINTYNEQIISSNKLSNHLIFVDDI